MPTNTLTKMLAKMIVDWLEIDVTKRHHVEFIIYTLFCIIYIICLYILFKLRRKLIDSSKNVQLVVRDKRRPRYIHNKISKCDNDWERLKHTFIKFYRNIKSNRIALIEFICFVINCMLFYSYYRMFHLIG